MNKGSSDPFVQTTEQYTKETLKNDGAKEPKTETPQGERARICLLYTSDAADE